MEVHLWRGSAEQRALRRRVRKLGQFAYFDEQLGRPDWRDKVVLDFGGNAGNLLLNPDCTIRQENYYCVDVLREAIEEGRARFPRAHWLHYDRYNCSFNPEGLKDVAVPEAGTEFDVILAYSVFTHTTLEEMRDLVAQLRARLAPCGALAFTFIDPHFRPWPASYDGSTLKWRLEHFRQTDPGVRVESLLRQSRGAEWCALVGNRRLFVNSSGVWEGEDQTCMTYDVYYTAEFVRREFPGASVLPPVGGEMQHCCVIRREA